MQGLSLGTARRSSRADGVPSAELCEVGRLAASHHILLLQETHGVLGDRIPLQAMLPLHVVIADFGEHAGVGGALTIVARSVLVGAASVRHDPWIQGTCQEVCINARGLLLSIVNAHWPRGFVPGEDKHSEVYRTQGVLQKRGCSLRAPVGTSWPLGGPIRCRARARTFEARTLSVSL